MHISEAWSGIPERCTQTGQLEKLRARWTPSSGPGCRADRHGGESSLEVSSISVLFVNTSG